MIRPYFASLLRYVADRLVPASQTVLTAQDVQAMIDAAFQAYEDDKRPKTLSEAMSRVQDREYANGLVREAIDTAFTEQYTMLLASLDEITGRRLSGEQVTQV